MSVFFHQHVVQHHVYSNDVYQDPDVKGNILLRLNPVKPVLQHHAWQYLYIFALITLKYMFMPFDDLMDVYKGIMLTPMSPYMKTTRRIDAIGFILFHIRTLIIPLMRAPRLSTLLAIYSLYAIGGTYIALFFIISHNFDGVTILNDTGHKEKESFLRSQVLTSSNVGGTYLCMLNGGKCETISVIPDVASLCYV